MSFNVIYINIYIRCDKQPGSCIAAHSFVIWSPQILLASLYEGIYACNQAHTCDKLEGHTTELDSQGVFASIFPSLSLSLCLCTFASSPTFIPLKILQVLDPALSAKTFFLHSKS